LLPVYQYSQFRFGFPTQSPPCVWHGIRSRPDRLGHLMRDINQIIISITISNTVTAMCVAWRPITTRSARPYHVRHHSFLSIILYNISCTSLYFIGPDGHNCIISLGILVVFHISHYVIRISCFVFHANHFTFSHNHGLSNNKVFLFKTFKHTSEEKGVLGTSRFLTQSFFSFHLKHNLKSRNLDFQLIL